VKHFLVRLHFLIHHVQSGHITFLKVHTLFGPPASARDICSAQAAHPETCTGTAAYYQAMLTTQDSARTAYLCWLAHSSEAQLAGEGRAGGPRGHSDGPFVSISRLVQEFRPLIPLVSGSLCPRSSVCGRGRAYITPWWVNPPRSDVRSVERISTVTPVNSVVAVFFFPSSRRGVCSSSSCILHFSVLVGIMCIITRPR
jgi:hypothetical protein